MVKKIALAVTSYHGPFYEDGAKTGAFYSEVLHPWVVFTKAGFHVDLVSETGSFGWDQHSIEAPMATEEELALIKPGSDSDFAKAVASVKKAGSVDPADYAAFFAAGGHGTIFDFDGKAPDVAKLAGGIYDHNGQVAAVCHGPVILGDVKDKHGELVAKGKKLTGFPDSGEEAMQLTALLDKNHWLYTSEILKRVGHYEPVEGNPFGAKTVYDGRVGTGANPASATPLAQQVVEHLQ